MSRGTSTVTDKVETELGGGGRKDKINRDGAYLQEMVRGMDVGEDTNEHGDDNDVNNDRRGGGAN